MKSASNGFVWLIWSCPKTCNACWFLFVQTLLITNNKKERRLPKSEAGGDEKRFLLVGLQTIHMLGCLRGNLVVL